MKYTGQTRRPFTVCFQERFRDYKYGNGETKFATHLLENKQSTGPMENIMETLHITGKGRKMDTLERFYIFHETKINNQINGRLIIKLNIIFETVVQKDRHKEIPTKYKQFSNST
jgi:hypothetical protein